MYKSTIFNVGIYWCSKQIQYTGSIFTKSKHVFITIGCWDILWHVVQLLKCAPAVQAGAHFRRYLGMWYASMIEVKSIIHSPIILTSQTFSCATSENTWPWTITGPTLILHLAFTVYVGRPAFPNDLAPHLVSRRQVEDFSKACWEMGIRYLGVCCGNRSCYIRTMAEAVGRTPPGSLYSPNMKLHYSRRNFGKNKQQQKWYEEKYMVE